MRRRDHLLFCGQYIAYYRTDTDSSRMSGEQLMLPTVERKKISYYYFL